MKLRRPIVHFLQRYSVWWYGLTVALYGLMIPLTVLVFPATTLLLTIVVLFGGFTSSVAAMASILSDAEDSDVPEP